MQDTPAWALFQDLLLSQLAALEHEKMVPAWSPALDQGFAAAAGAPPGASRQKLQVLALRRGLAGCVRQCVHALLGAAPAPPSDAGASSCGPPATSTAASAADFLKALLRRVASMSTRASTAALVLGAAADALTDLQAGGGAVPPPPLLHADEGLALGLELAERLLLLRPASQLRHVLGAVLRALGACCGAAGAGAGPVLALLAACEPRAYAACCLAHLPAPRQLSRLLSPSSEVQQGGAGTVVHGAAAALQAAGPQAQAWVASALLRPCPGQPEGGAGALTELGQWLRDTLQSAGAPEPAVGGAEASAATVQGRGAEGGDGQARLQRLTALASLLPLLRPRASSDVLDVLAALPLLAGGLGGGQGGSEGEEAWLAAAVASLSFLTVEAEACRGSGRRSASRAEGRGGDVARGHCRAFRRWWWRRLRGGAASRPCAAGLRALPWLALLVASVGDSGDGGTAAAAAKLEDADGQHNDDEEQAVDASALGGCQTLLHQVRAVAALGVTHTGSAQHCSIARGRDGGSSGVLPD